MIKFGPLMIFPDAYNRDDEPPPAPEHAPDNPVERAEREYTPASDFQTPDGEDVPF